MLSWLWEWFRRRDDGLSDISTELLDKLGLPEETKQFVMALPLPRDPSSVVYLLTCSILSQRSVEDVNRLVQSVKPQTVLAQVDSNMMLYLFEEEHLLNDRVPDSPFQVLGACFMGKHKYPSFESVAGIEVSRELFGTTYHGPIIEAKHAAANHACVFKYLVTTPEYDVDDVVDGNDDHGKVSGNHGSSKDGTLNGVKPFSGETRSRWFNGERGNGNGSPRRNFRVPLAYRQLLSNGLTTLAILKHQDESLGNTTGNTMVTMPSYVQHLQSVFVYMDELNKKIPGNEATDVRYALSALQKVLVDVENGNEVNLDELSLVCRFKLTLEYLRLLLNDAAKNPKLQRVSPKNFNYEELPYEEKRNVLLTKALQNEATRSKVVVAVVTDGSKSAAIRKYWNVPSSPEVDALADGCLLHVGDEDAGHEATGVVPKPVVVVGAGAAALAGAASLPQLHVPTILNVVMVHTKRSVATFLSKLLLPKFGGVLALKSSSSVTLGKIRAGRAIVSLAQNRSLAAIQSAFYGVMRMKEGLSSPRRPWLMLGGTVLTGAGLFWSGERIEVTIEALPTATAVAQLGRGIQKLKDARERLALIETKQVWQEIYAMLYRSYRPTAGNASARR